MDRIETNKMDAVTRREFVKKSSLAFGSAAVTQFPHVITAHAAPDDPILVGLVGCGGRGTGAALNILRAKTRVIYPKTGYHTEDAAGGARVQAQNVKIVALADLFKDRLDSCREQLKRVEMDIPEDHCFVGFDACRNLLALPEINYVILAGPPQFRPAHLRAAIEAGKHVFAEKPLAMDGPGVRSVIETGEIAETQEPWYRGRNAAAPPAQLRGDGQTPPGRRDRRESSSAGPTGTGEPSGSSRRNPAGPTWSGSCATGTTSHGCQATTSWSSTSTTWT